jgi:hypothetical protein
MFVVPYRCLALVYIGISAENSVAIVHRPLYIKDFYDKRGVYLQSTIPFIQPPILGRVTIHPIPPPTPDLQPITSPFAVHHQPITSSSPIPSPVRSPAKVNFSPFLDPLLAVRSAHSGRFIAQMCSGRRAKEIRLKIGTTKRHLNCGNPSKIGAPRAMVGNPWPGEMLGNETEKPL